MFQRHVEIPKKHTLGQKVTVRYDCTQGNTYSCVHNLADVSITRDRDWMGLKTHQKCDKCCSWTC